VCLQLWRWYLQFEMTVANSFCSAFHWTGCVHLSQRVVHCFSFQFWLVYSLMSLQAENRLGFGQNFMFQTQHFPFTRCYLMNWTLQCDAVMEPSLHYIIFKYIVEYSFLFSLVQKSVKKPPRNMGVIVKDGGTFVWTMMYLSWSVVVVVCEVHNWHPDIWLHITGQES